MRAADATRASEDVPSRFWEEYCLDADVVIALLGLEKPAADQEATDSRQLRDPHPGEISKEEFSNKPEPSESEIS